MQSVYFYNRQLTQVFRLLKLSLGFSVFFLVVVQYWVYVILHLFDSIMQLKSKKKGKKVRASWGRCFAFTAVQMHCICCWRDIIFYLIHHYCVCESQHVCLYLTVSTTRGSTLFLFTLPHIGCLLHFLTANKHVDCFGGLLMKAFSNESIGWLLKGSRTDHSREREREKLSAHCTNVERDLWWA